MNTNKPKKYSLVINTKDKWSRRTLLSRIGKSSAAGALMPFVPIMEAGAQTDRAVRYVQWFYANGSTSTKNYWQTEDGPINTPAGSPYKPFDKHKDDVAFIGNIHLRSALGVQDINPHNQTTRAVMGGDGRRKVNQGNPPFSTLDQAIANDLQARGIKTPYKSLVFGFKNPKEDVIISINNGKTSNADRDPRQLYDRLFESALASSGGSSAQQGDGRKLSVLDFVGDTIKRLNPIVSSQDREKLDLHLNSIREVEERLELVANTNDGSCTAFREEDKLQQDPLEKFGDEILEAYTDLVVAAFACDLTRVAAFQMSFGHDFHSYEWLGLAGDFHGWTHNKVGTNGANQGGALGRINKAMTWRHEKVVGLMDKLKAVQEPEGTLLDNTGVLMWTETSRLHFWDDATWVLGGKLGNKINTGQYKNYGNVDHNMLLTTIAQGMGMETNRFGAPEFTAGTLPGLLKT